MFQDSRINKVLYGGDYNPEQWPEEIWEEDMRLFKLAGIDEVTLNVFSWAALQPSEDTYNFEKLDKIMDLVEANGLKVFLATSTAAHPAWMAKRHPDILRTEFSGMKRKFGSRHNSCQNSPTYQKYSVLLAKKLAERYGERECVIGWHICNEYGGECYCENCEKQFRVWLKKKYGTIEEVNKAWDTSFWGHTFYDWDEIVLPNMLSEHFEPDRTTFQGISLDYRRFNSEGMLKCYQAEAAAIRSVVPDAKITTNLMGFYKPLDYQMWAKSMDFISWDNYPANEDPYSRIAMNHDLMRGIKGGQPFVLMEQTPSVTNWLAYNALKRPGVMRLWSYQAMAHGADAVLFFQMRRSIGACEKYHGAVIDHVGTENTRVFREISQLGKELQQLGDKTLGARSRAKAAILVDWDNWWAIEYSAGPSRDLKYLDEVFLYYRALEEQNYAVDIIGVEESDALPRDKRNHFMYGGVSCEASLLCDLMHLEGARELASYEEDFYAGTPVITENSFGAGKAYYVGTRSSQEFYRMFMRERMEEKGISPVLEAPEGVEATERFKDGKGVMFVLNHNDEETVFVLNEARKDLLTGEQYEGGTVVTLEAKGVMLLEN
ncbi:beta-galactosidase [Blautia acetigignens]|uniref:beta-galactosidase n=1 Tax=Blautia acetigignens TaxID=2981783 RepID=A0ABV1CTZ2_9FIRM